MAAPRTGETVDRTPRTAVANYEGSMLRAASAAAARRPAEPRQREYWTGGRGTGYRACRTGALTGIAQCTLAMRWQHLPGVARRACMADGAWAGCPYAPGMCEGRRWGSEPLLKHQTKPINYKYIIRFKAGCVVASSMQ